jgi:hypothetical protein
MDKINKNQILFNYRDNDTNETIPNITSVVSISLAAFTEGKLNFTSDVIGNIKSTTNENGVLLIDLFKLFDANQKLIYLFKEKYFKYTIGLRLTITSQAMDPYATTVEIVNLDTLEWQDNAVFNGYDYANNNGSFYPEYTTNKPTDLKTLMSKYKEQELQFLATKAQYEADIKSNLDITVEKGQEYEPDTFRKVITRILEFQKGTLNSAIDYTKSTGLTIEQQRLTTINNVMDILTKMYPNVTIDDGEGIPYNNK